MKIFIYSFISLISLTFLILLYEFNTDYTIENSKFTNLANIKPGSLIICTHNYEHKDIIIVLSEIEKLSKLSQNFIMLFADKFWNYLLEPLRPSNVEFTYVQGNTVEKLSSKINLGHNVIMFLYKEYESKGPYYILKNTMCPLYLLKIKGDKTGSNHFNGNFFDIYINNYLSNYSIKYSKIIYNKDSFDTKPDIFIKKLKQRLYSKS
jgi:hypothetical protein